MVEPTKKKEEKKVYCKFCHRKIIRWRENSYKDYASRPAHRTCWKRDRDRILRFTPPFSGSYIL